MLFCFKLYQELYIVLNLLLCVATLLMEFESVSQFVDFACNFLTGEYV